MSQKLIKCKNCGIFPERHGGADKDDQYGPFHIVCPKCGIETRKFAYPKEAWNEWKEIQKK